MKLFYLANIKIPTEKAHGYQIMKMCEEFANEGLEVELIVTNRLGEIKMDPFEYYGIEKNFNITYLPVWDVLFLGKFGYLIEIFSFANQIKNKIDFNNSIIYTRDIILIRLLPKIKNLILELHALPNKIKKIKKIFSKTKQIICITNCLKDKIVNLGYDEKNILVAYDAVDIDKFDFITDNKLFLRQEFKLPSDKKIISYIGKLSTMGLSKGVDILIESFIRLRKDNDKILLLIVGLSKAEKDYLNNKFQEFGFDDGDYRLQEHVTRDVVPKFMKLSDVLVMSYPNIPFFACYNSPLKLFEYMASKCTIVASSLPAFCEVLNKNNAILFDINRNPISNLVDALSLAVKDAKSNFAQNAYNDVKQYTWRKRAYNIIAFLNH